MLPFKHVLLLFYCHSFIIILLLLLVLIYWFGFYALAPESRHKVCIIILSQVRWWVDRVREFCWEFFTVLWFCWFIDMRFNPAGHVICSDYQWSIYQSKLIFWAIEILQCILALKRLPEKHMLIKLAAQTNKRTQILIQTGRGKRQGGTKSNMCSASANGDTVINKSVGAFIATAIVRHSLGHGLLHLSCVVPSSTQPSILCGW